MVSPCPFGIRDFQTGASKASLTASVEAAKSPALSDSRSASSGSIGIPIAMVIPERERYGYLLMNRPRSNEKIDSHEPSHQIGISGWPAFFAISSKPRRSSLSVPVRLNCPSGNMQTRSPFFNASIVIRIASRGWSRRMVTVFKIREKKRIERRAMNVSSITNRTGRAQAAEMKRPSAKVRWFGSKSAPPVSGMRSGWATRMW